jgi:hypothetical protein
VDGGLVGVVGGGQDLGEGEDVEGVGQARMAVAASVARPLDQWVGARL